MQRADAMDAMTDSRVSSVMELMSSLLNSPDPWDGMEQLIGCTSGHAGPRAYAHISMTGQSGHCIVRRLRSDQGVDLLPHLQGPGAIPPHCGGFMEQISHTPLPKILHHLDLAGDPVFPPHMAVYRSAMVMPLFIDQVAHDWVVLFDRNPAGIQARDLEELIVRVTLVATAMTNLQVTRQLMNANLRIQEEIAAIATIQRALLPRDLPEVPGLRVAASYETLGQAGGDLYDLVPLGRNHQLPGTATDQRWAILIGDVSGHGPAAAMVMAMLHSILHAYPCCPEGPGEVLTHMNRHLCAKQLGAIFATAFLAIYEPSTQVLSYARAGHHPPLLLSPGQPRRCAPLDAVGDVPLGVDPDATFAEARAQLRRGQALLLYTDGIIEARNPAGEFFDIRRLEASLISAPAAPPQAIVLHINESLLQHTAGTPATDDQTLVAVEVC